MLRPGRTHLNRSVLHRFDIRVVQISSDRWHGCQIFGNTENEVVQVTRMVEDYAKNGVTGLANISSTLPYPQIEWKIDVDKQKAAQLGVNISDVGAIVQMLTNGFKAGEYRPDDSRDEVEIRVRFKRDERSLTGIDDLKVPSPFNFPSLKVPS